MFHSNAVSTILKLALAAFAFVACFTTPLSSETMSPGIQVGLNPQKPLWIKVTLRSGSDNTATFLKHKLPWGNTYSMVLLAATPQGAPLKKFYPVDDPMFDEISVPPRGTLTGDIDLESTIPDLRQLTKVSDVHLFWAYESPKELNLPHWSGGWILIPKRK
jgi:hypothetical protein